MKAEIFLISLLIFVLLIVIAAGVFIYHSWKTTNIVISDQMMEEEASDLLIKETAEVKEEAKDELIEEEIMEKAHEIIEESEELIAKAQEFLGEEKEKMALMNAALEKSKQIKGLYLNEFIANSQSAAAFNVRQNIINLLSETELNGVVIDVKEAYGPNLPNSLKALIDEFHQKDVWVIARICAFRDNSLIKENSDLYLKTMINSTTSQATSTEEISTSTEDFWQDSGKGYWLDPKSTEVHDYLIEFSKRAIDFGFDELQFDYVRFPSDGDVKNIIYPFHNEEQQKYEVIREFFLKITSSLKEYKPSIILSADLFGYVAGQYQALDIGQRIIDAADTFDYISFMLYPSHFYGGFRVGEDLKRGLPALSFPYKDDTTTSTSHLVSTNPYQVILRSIFLAADYLSLFGSEAKIRPWLQDFDLKFETSQGIYYNAEKIQAQIQGAEDAGSSGWLFWNSANVYTEEAFSKIEE